MGKNFELYQEVTKLHKIERRKPMDRGGGPKGQRSRHQPSFPPLLTTFTTRHSKPVVRHDTRPIPMTSDLRNNLCQVLGDQNVAMLESNIGFQEKQAHEIPVVSENPPPVFRTVFGERPRPDFKFTSKPHQTKVNKKFFWPNMTNALCKIPVEVKPPPQVRDLRSWLDAYGEPQPDRIPTGSMTTFKPSTRRFGKDKSRGSELLRTATGPEWKRAYERKREEVLSQTR
mmetsp:Transcript_52964/g.115031  ORF Transcript_52964/g.115031 Transcript_52964/m.115031 type:complete len:228 (+) Transcript_52964:1-684(+)